jgi:hypothetical protein
MKVRYPDTFLVNCAAPKSRVTDSDIRSDARHARAIARYSAVPRPAGTGAAVCIVTTTLARRGRLDRCIRCPSLHALDTFFMNPH